MKYRYQLISSIGIEEIVYCRERKERYCFLNDLELRFISETGFKIVDTKLNENNNINSIYSCVSYHLYGSFEYTNDIRERVSSFLKNNLNKKQLSLSIQSFLDKYSNGIHINEYIKRIRNDKDWGGDFIQLGIISKIYRLPIYLISNQFISPFGWNHSYHDMDNIMKPLWLYYKKNWNFFILEVSHLRKDNFLRFNFIDNYLNFLMVYSNDIRQIFMKFNPSYDSLLINNTENRIDYHRKFYKHYERINFIIISHSYDLNRHFINKLIFRSFDDYNNSNNDNEQLFIENVYDHSIHIDDKSKEIIKKVKENLLFNIETTPKENELSILPRYRQSIPLLTLSYNSKICIKLRVIYSYKNDNQLFDEIDLSYLKDKWIIYSPNDDDFMICIHNILLFIDKFMDIHNNSLIVHVEIGCPSILLFPYGSFVIFDIKELKRQYLRKSIDDIMSNSCEFIYLKDEYTDYSSFIKKTVKEFPPFIKRMTSLTPSSFHFVSISDNMNDDNHNKFCDIIIKTLYEKKKEKLMYNDEVLMKFCYNERKTYESIDKINQINHYIKYSGEVNPNGFIDDPFSIEIVLNKMIKKIQCENFSKIIMDSSLPFIYLFKMIEKREIHDKISQIYDTFTQKEANFIIELIDKVNKYIESNKNSYRSINKSIISINKDNMIKCIKNGHLDEIILGDLSEIIKRKFNELKKEVQKWIKLLIYNEIKEKCFIDINKSQSFVRYIMVILKNCIEKYQFNKMKEIKLKRGMINEIINNIDMNLSVCIGNIESNLYYEAIEEMRILIIEDIKKIIEIIKITILSLVKNDHKNINECDDGYIMIKKNFETLRNHTLNILGFLIKNDINQYNHINKKLFNLMRMLINNDFNNIEYDIDHIYRCYYDEIESFFSSFCEIEISFSLANNLLMIIDSWCMKNKCLFNNLDEITNNNLNDILSSSSSSSIKSRYLLFETFNMLKLKYKNHNINYIKSIYSIYDIKRNRNDNNEPSRSYFEQAMDGLMNLDNHYTHSITNYGVIEHQIQLKTISNDKNTLMPLNPTLLKPSPIGPNQKGNDDSVFDNQDIMISHKIKRSRKRRKFSCSLKDLINYKYLKVGGEVKAFKQIGIITENGILYKDEVFDTPSAFAARCLQEKISQETHGSSLTDMNKITSNYNGWDYVKYKDKKLGYWRTLWEKERES